MFPAYLKLSLEDVSDVAEETSKQFLQNPSYDAIPVSSATIAESISSDSESSSEAESRAMIEYSKQPSPPKEDFFYVDRERKKEYLKLDFIPIRARPIYTISKRNNFSKSHNKVSKNSTR